MPPSDDDGPVAHVLWINAGLSCDGDSVSLTVVTLPSVEDIAMRALPGLPKEALLASYDPACEGTALQNSHLVIEEAPIVVYCPSCHAEKTLSSMQSFACPECNAPVSDVLRGRELEVVALEIQP